ncbi:MAG: TonB-dependent receptor [Bacteroidota bacterium]
MTTNYSKRWQLHIFTTVVGMLAMSLGIAQNQVSGTITDLDGTPLVGVSVFYQSSTEGILSNGDGTYTIDLPARADSLIFSYLGYKKEERWISAANSAITLDVQLSPQALSTDEVVVVGYGVQRKSDLTGSISSVDAEEIQRIPTPNLGQALQGKVAGVQITPSSGAPGAGAIIRIRGVGTLNNASPLFVVDGMLTDNIDFLNLNDVSSVEVLKDASATAIYGSRGANGVIIISTNKGTAGPTQFSVNSYYGIQEITNFIDLTNAQEYAILSNELAMNDGRPEVFEDPLIFGEGTNWQDEIYQRAPIQNYQIAANGGNEKVNFNISADFFSQEGIIKGSKYDRATLRINNQYKLTKNIRLGHNLAFSYIANENAAGVVGNAYRSDPTVPVVDSLGNFGNTSVRASTANPVAQIEFNNNFGRALRSLGNVYLEMDFLKDFTFRSNLGLDGEAFQTKNFTPVFFVSSIQQNDTNVISVGAGYNGSLLWENTLTYSKEWEKHRLNVLGGVTAQSFRSENLGGSRRNVAEEDANFYFLSSGQLNGQTNFNSAFEWAMLSYLARVNYTFDNRYLFTASFRADGSSRFGVNNRYGYFPSFAAGWNIHEERFFSNVPFINRLKLRASWGQIGNDKIGAYAGIPQVDRGLGAVFGPGEILNIGASIINLSNPDIRWEETSQTDIGIELGAFEDKLLVEVDYYSRVTNDILVSVPIPDYVGSRSDPVINAARVLNRGWDVNLNWRHQIGDFVYGIGGVASTVYNEVLALGEGREEILGGGLGVGGLLGTRTVVGQPIGAFYGYQVAGVFQNEEELSTLPSVGIEQPGDLRFVDVNDDGEITPDDRTFLGSPIPNFVYGFNLRLGFKGLELTADFNGQSGNKLINAKQMARFGTPNFERVYLDRWNGEGSSNTEPRVTNGGHNYEVSDRFIYDGSFMRLRNLQLSYQLPAKASRAIRFSNIRLFINGTNLITWTNYPGYTPEISSGSVISVGIDNGQYPIAKVFTSGIQANF